MSRGLRQLPNVISSIRILPVLPIAWTLAPHRLIAILWLFGVAAVIARDGITGLGAVCYRWLLGPVPARPPVVSGMDPVLVYGRQPARGFCSSERMRRSEGSAAP